MQRLIRFWVRRVSPRILSLVVTIGALSLAACLLASFVFSVLAQEILEKETFEFDTAILLSIHQWANPVLDQVALTMTALGNPVFVVTIAISLFVLLLRWKQVWEAKIFGLACIGTVILDKGLKLFFARPRPQLWTRLIAEPSYSFPSGHALGSMVLYGFLAYILSSKFPRASGWIYGIAAGLIAAIGMSRLYLGVHWVTDIMAGFSVGFVWLMTCVTLIKIQKSV
jgi:membrane-associated phospholipid phosphatase